MSTVTTAQKIAFTPYNEGAPGCAVIAVTPPDQAHMHTYYDVTPWSPSGRYLVSMRLPFEDRRPSPSDAAEVCVIDLHERTLRPVYTTTAWGFQTGAHQMWGGDDHALYFNDRRNGQPVGVRLDLASGSVDRFDGPIWQVSPDASAGISPCLIRANLTQPEYGVAVAAADQLVNSQRANPEDGLFRVDMATGEQRLLIGLDQAWEVLADREDLADAVLYGFHAKFNPQGTRLMFVVRAQQPSGAYVASLLTSRADGNDLRVTVSHRVWQRGGHHPIWYPDGEHVLMNLTPGDTGMHFCLVNIDGSIEILVDQPEGSGHPVVSPDLGKLLTDVTNDDDRQRTVQVRMVDLTGSSSEPGGGGGGDGAGYRDLIRVTSPAARGEDLPLRRDAHATWDRTGNRFLFQAAPTGKRQLFIADPGLPAGEIPAFG